MASLPNALQRREQLYGPPGRTDFVGQTRSYLEAQEHSDALEFALKIPDATQRSELLREIRDLAQRQGNWFLLNRIDGTEEVPEDVWRKTFTVAKDQGRLHYALKIARRLNDADAVQELELTLGLRQPEPEPSAVEAVEESGEGGDEAEAAG